jgi:hypothetical protein
MLVIGLYLTRTIDRIGRDKRGSRKRTVVKRFIRVITDVLVLLENGNRGLSVLFKKESSRIRLK